MYISLKVKKMQEIIVNCGSQVGPVLDLSYICVINSS
jgi:hypothetical protein